jgi:transposase-like protein
MPIRLHANATTTPKTRRYIQQSDKTNKALAQQFGISIDTVRRWRKRDEVHDRSHTAHQLQTTLTDAQEAVVVELRRTLLLPLDDLLVITREFLNPDVSRSGLDRCLRRHGISRLTDLIPKEETGEKAKPKTFKSYEPGFVHVDIKYLPQMPDESSRRYLFVVIDRASRWVYLELKKSKSSTAATSFLERVVAKAPFESVSFSPITTRPSPTVSAWQGSENQLGITSSTRSVKCTISSIALFRPGILRPTVWWSVLTVAL